MKSYNSRLKIDLRSSNDEFNIPQNVKNFIRQEMTLSGFSRAIKLSKCYDYFEYHLRKFIHLVLSHNCVEISRFDYEFITISDQGESKINLEQLEKFIIGEVFDDNNRMFHFLFDEVDPDIQMQTFFYLIESNNNSFHFEQCGDLEESVICITNKDGKEFRCIYAHQTSKVNFSKLKNIDVILCSYDDVIYIPESCYSESLEKIYILTLDKYEVARGFVQNKLH